VITVPTLQVLAGVVISLFLIQLVRRLTVNAQNPLAAAVNDGTSFLVAG
jgi:hypothetical protein